MTSALKAQTLEGWGSEHCGVLKLSGNRSGFRTLSFHIICCFTSPPVSLCPSGSTCPSVDVSLKWVYRASGHPASLKKPVGVPGARAASGRDVGVKRQGRGGDEDDSSGQAVSGGIGSCAASQVRVGTMLTQPCLHWCCGVPVRWHCFPRSFNGIGNVCFSEGCIVYFLLNNRHSCMTCKVLGEYTAFAKK